MTWSLSLYPLALRRLYLCVCVSVCGLFSSCGERGLLLIAACGFLIALASLMEHGLSDAGLNRFGSGVLAHRLSCSVACGIFPGQGWNLYLLHW